MKKAKPKLLIAKHSILGRMIDIADADNGLSCDCLCSCCGDRLIAKQGEVNDWHFAHESGADCAGVHESALHQAAKQIIKEEGLVYVGKYNPIEKAITALEHLMYTENAYGNRTSVKEMFLSLPILEFSKYVNEDIIEQIIKSKKFCDISQLQVADVELEKRVHEPNITPDVTCTFNGHQMFIEVVVSHICDENKISKLKQLNVPAIEIHLAPLQKLNFSMSDVKDAVTNGYFRDGTEIIISGETNENFKCQWLVKPKYILNADTHAFQLISEAITSVNEELRLIKLNQQEKEAKETAKRVENAAAKTKLSLFNTKIIITEKPNCLLIWIPYVERPIYEKISNVINEYGGKRNDVINNWIIKNTKIKNSLIESLSKADSKKIIESNSVDIKAMLAKIRTRNDLKPAQVYYPGSENVQDTLTNTSNVDAHIQSKSSLKQMKIEEIYAKYSSISDHRWRQKSIDAEIAALEKEHE